MPYYSQIPPHLNIKSKFYFDIIVDSHVLVRNNTERFHIPFIQLLPMITSCIILVQYHNQEINIDTIHWLYSYFKFYMYSCVCVCAGACVWCLCVFSSMRFYHKCRIVRLPPYLRCETRPSQGTLVLPFYSHSHFPPCSTP